MTDAFRNRVNELICDVGEGRREIGEVRDTIFSMVTSLEEELLEALRNARVRLGLIFTAEQRLFGMAYVQGCAKAGQDEIGAALAAVKEEKV